MAPRVRMGGSKGAVAPRPRKKGDMDLTMAVLASTLNAFTNPLISRALARRMYEQTSREMTTDEIGLALAWARGDVALAQVASAMLIGGSGSAVYRFLALGLREHIRRASALVKGAK
jgi:hypothetical protein